MEQSIIVIDQHYHGLNPVQLGHESCSPSHAYGPAIRTHWLLHYVVSGYGTFTREGVTYNIGPGQMFIIPPYIETFYQADGQLPWKYIWIGFTSDEIPDVFCAPVISNTKIGDIFNEMLTCDNLENGRSAFLASCLWKLVSVFSEKIEGKPNCVEKALNYMHSDYANGITIKKVADSIGLNQRYFCSLFSKQIGTTPSQYLINLRLNKAAELMAIYHEPPTTAALSVGYNDIYHFSKAFKKHFGVSPRAYSKNKL